MEYIKRVGRRTFVAEVTIAERGEWRIGAGAHRATLPMTGAEADAWVALGKPSEPALLPEHVQAHLASLAACSGGKPKVSTPKAERYERRDFMPLDGEEVVQVIPVEKRVIKFGEPGDVVTGRVVCDSPRHDEPARWFVVQLPHSSYDTADRKRRDDELLIEGVSPAEFAEQHRAWHRREFGVSARVELDRWIERHRNVAPPTLSDDERAEIDRMLAIAKSER
jgi:hypothetical protein